ncbi:MAG: ArsR family transcriptional regulator, arsenate/arsenite/antimonite-responsive transcriptional [Clostridiales bacterium]|jgi:ArsR family transcriptional regulator|nr:ArsR family transcriptional regulator, arsenate/arsenite/antimonite-responsive transcriptional [Clostridiales bacterium]
MQQPTSVFKLLSDETRLRILMLLYREPLCVCELVGILDVPQPRISKNLAKLRDLGLVEDERREKFVFYALRKENPLLMQVLETLGKDIDQYEMFKTDYQRLDIKEQYLNQCQIIVPNY